MKKRILMMVTAAACSAAHAEAWHVVVTASYLNSHNILVDKVPVADVEISDTRCYVGMTHKTEMVTGSKMESGKHLCMTRMGVRTNIHGLVFPDKPPTDLAFKGERGAQTRGELSYGVPVSLTIAGTYAKYSFGPYTLEATRLP